MPTSRNFFWRRWRW